MGDGSELGVRISYAIQDKPRGIADAFNVGAEFIGSKNVALILGDNIFYGQGLGGKLRELTNLPGANIFACKVSDPSRYGIVELTKDNRIVSIEEKPSKPKSNYAVPGLYFYDNKVLNYIKHVEPSQRGELEISDINRIYWEAGQLTVNKLERGTTWLDAGTFDSLLESSMVIKTIQKRHGIKIACLEEISYRNGWITREEAASRLNKNSEYLTSTEIDELLETN